DQIHTLQEAARKEGYPLWYRGHRLAEWTLQTSLHRHVENSLNAIGITLPEGEKVEMMRDVYKSLYRKYKARAWHLLTFREMSDWGIIFSMQHHGIPTRLLDWSESFICALYFAHCGRKSSDDAAIFILSPEHLNYANYGYTGQVALGENVGNSNVEEVLYHPGYVSFAYPLHTIAVAPVLSNPRMLAQQSAFTLSGDPFQPMEERYSQHVKKIVLPAATYEESLRFLNLGGRGHFSYFPDFEGLSNELIEGLNREVKIAQEYLDGRRADES